MNNQIHTIAYVKRQAKNLKKEQNITHTEALESISKSLGYSNWMHCSRSLNQQKTDDVKTDNKLLEISFSDWLKKHKNRDSPLGDLATDMIGDRTWPSYQTLEEYRRYLSFRNASYDAIETLKKAWKTYSAYLKRMKSPVLNKAKKKKTVPINQDQRRVVYVSNVKPIHSTKRTVEKFVVGDKAWISWDGRKALPVTITDVDDRHYSFGIERPLKQAGSSHYLMLDEVRSTPELACMNYVTF